MQNKLPPHDLILQAPERLPALLISVDTEGDNLWSAPSTVTTRNSGFLERFQLLCEKYDFKPTWLTNWEMASCGRFREFAGDVLRRNTGEIGMHLHAWNSPPFDTRDDCKRQLCLTQYPEPVMRAKVLTLTELLEDTFGERVVSHRAGRWGFNEVYARVLADAGYLVDCSVTPHVAWDADVRGESAFGGADYRGFPDDAYWVALDDIRHRGASQLLEIPMTIVQSHQHWLAAAVHRVGRLSKFAHRAANYVFPQQMWFRPFRNNVRQLPQLLNWAETQQRDYLQLMLHSSELMPGGSPYFPTEGSIERLYERLESLFEAARSRFVGLTLREYRSRVEGIYEPGPHSEAFKKLLPRTNANLAD